MHIRWRGLELPSAVTCDAATLSADLRQVHRRAVRARLRLDDRQRPAPHSAFQPGRQRGHADQGPQRPARIHHDQGRARGRHRHRAQRQVAGGEEPQRLDARAARREEHGRPDHRRRHRDRRSGRSAQHGSRAGHAHRRRAVRDGNGRRERPRLRSGQRAQPEHPGNRHHSDRRGVQPGRPRALRHRRNPRRPEDELRQAHARNLDQRLGRSGNGAGRGGQDSPQAPQSVRAVHRARPAGPLAGPRQRRSASTPAWKRSST